MPAYGIMDIGFAGLKQGLGNSEVVSRAAAEVVSFGKPIFFAAGDADKCYQTSGAGRTLNGVSLSTQKVGGNYQIGEAVNVLTEGSVQVIASEAVAANAPAFLTASGDWTDEASGNTATPYIFRTAAAANGLATLEVIKKPAI